MRVVLLYLAVAALTALAAYIIRSNSRIASNLLLIISLISLSILVLSILIEQ